MATANTITEEPRCYRLGVDDIPPPDFSPEFSACLVATLAEWFAGVDLDLEGGGDDGATD